MSNKIIIYSDGEHTHLFVDGKYIANTLSVIYEHSTNREKKISTPHIEIGLDSLPAKEADMPKEVTDFLLQILKENSTGE